MKCKLGDLFTEFHSGDSLPSELIQDMGPYVVFGANGRRGYYTKYNSEGKFVIIGRQGAYCGNVNYYKGQAFLTEHAIYGKIKETFDYTYICYCLRSINLARFQGQSAQPGLSVKTLSLIDIDVPDYTIQYNIGELTRSLESKIFLNRKENEILEKMAKQLYDYWFVQFDFPDENGRPYKSSGGAMEYNPILKREIPKGWEVRRLDEISEVCNGATPSTAVDSNYGGDIIWVTPKDLSDQKSKFTFYSERNITQCGYDSCSTRMLPKGTILMSSRAPIGLLSIASCKLCTNQGFKSIVLNDIKDNLYLYFYLKMSMKQIEQMGSGTTFKEVSRESMNKFSLLYVSDRVLYAKWADLVKPLFSREEIISKETLQLTSLRDFLLPLLMNGQVTIKD